MNIYKNIQLKNFNKLNTDKNRFKYLLLASVKVLKFDKHYLTYSNGKQANTQLNFLNQLINCYLKLKSPKPVFTIFPSSPLLFFKTRANLQILNRSGHLTRLISKIKNFYLNPNELPNKSIIYFSNLKNIFNRLHQRFRAKIEFIVKNNRSAKNKYLFSLSSAATGGVFTWDEFKITNDDLKSEVNEILSMFNVEDKKENNSKNDKKLQNKISIDLEKSRLIQDNEWKMIYDKPDLIIWRREIILSDNDLSKHAGAETSGTVNYDIYEYKVLGRINDATPIEFYKTQIDLNFRKEWDYLVLHLDLIEEEVSTKTELIRWVMRFPYPLYPREYIFVRRFCFDPQEKLLILVSRAIPECKIEKNSEQQHLIKDDDETTIHQHEKVFSYPQSNKQYVRVTKFKSNMIIMPHTDLDKQGLNYVIQYYDINKAKIPKIAYKWMAASGLPDFIDRVQRAAHKLQHKYEKTNINQNELLKNVSVFYLNEPDSKPTKLENVGEKLPANNEQVNNKNLANTQDQKTKNEQFSNINQLLINFNEFYLKSIFEKFYNDFFNENEPHPAFFNY